MLFGSVPFSTVAAFTDAPCGDVQFVWSRGTGQPIAVDTPGTVTFQELRDRTPGLVLSRVNLGDTGTFGGGFSYPAQGGDFGFLTNWTVPQVGAYRDSVDQGTQELAAYLTNRAQQCPNEVFALGGWSQGAEVTGRGLFLLDQAVRDRVAYAALFGDPTYISGSAELVPFTDWCIGFAPPWLRGTGKCWDAGFFGPRFPYVPSDVEQRVGSWCRAGDGSCSGILNDVLFSTGGADGQHDKYFKEDADAAMAMREATTHLKAFLPALASQMDDSYLEFATGAAGADFVFVFDTTGSMSGSIANMKTQATALAHQWLTNSTNGRVALVDFKDQGDAYVARVDAGLTADEAVFQNAVNGLSASGGGDTPEAQLSGLMTALNGLSWQAGATKVALVITDAMGKDPEPITGFTKLQVTQRAMEIDPVAIYGVDVAGDSQVSGFMQSMADATAGRVFTLEPNQTLSDLLGTVITGVTLSPVADLGGPYFAQTGNPVHFRAVRSFDPDGTLASYRWDFDANGTIDQTTTGPTVDHTYPGAYSGQAAVRVVSADGGQAISTAAVTVDAAGLSDDVPIKPTSATATVTGPGQVTVSWIPAASDRADGYLARLSGTNLMRATQFGSGNSLVFTGLDLSQPIKFEVRAENEFGGSAPVSTPQVGGTAPVTTTRVSESTSHGQGNGLSDDSYMSQDARYVTYRSTASTLVSGDTNGVMDAFVHDRLTATTTRVSTTGASAQGNAQSDDPAFGANGRYVTFRSQASNFVASDTNGSAWDIFVKDLQTGAIERVSVSSVGAQANNRSSDPAISADGRYVVFSSLATNLVTGDTNGQEDIFLRDRTAGTTIRISVSSSGVAGNGLSDDPILSDDGRYLVYQSTATNLVTGDTNAVRDIFLFDRVAATTSRLSLSSAGAQANAASNDPAISPDGSRVAFESDATNLVTGDTNAKQDVFLRVITTGVTTRVSVTNAGAQGTGRSSDPSLSIDGTIVAFTSSSASLVAGDTNGKDDIFVRNTTAGTTVRFSLSTSGAQADNLSDNPSIAGDGRTVAFHSDATNLVTGDTNNLADVFVRGPAMGPS